MNEELAIKIANDILDQFTINGSDLNREQEEYNSQIEEIASYIIETYTNPLTHL